MGLTRKLFVLTKVSTKLGLAGGAVYFTHKEGLWGDAESTAAFMQRLGPHLPALNTILPESIIQNAQSFTEKMEIWANPNHKSLPEYWNGGVFLVIRTLDNLPTCAVSAKDKVFAWVAAAMDQSSSASQSD